MSYLSRIFGAKIQITFFDKNASAARFARQIVGWDFSYDFQTLCTKENFIRPSFSIADKNFYSDIPKRIQLSMSSHMLFDLLDSCRLFFCLSLWIQST